MISKGDVLMKIYHISDTIGFFNKLSTCKGDVEIVSGDGTHVSLKEIGDRENLKMLAQTYTNGIIREIELTFSVPEDAAVMCSYIAGMKVAV